MATSQQPGAESGTDDGETKKTVQVIAYATDEAFKSERAMADELDASRSYYQRERRKSRTVELVYGGEDFERTETVFDDHVRDALMEADIRSDTLDVREEIDVSRPYKYKPHKFVREIRDELCDDLPAKLEGGVTRPSYWSYKWQDDDSRSRVVVRADKLDYRRVLLHHSERNGRRKYETEHKHLSAAFTIELGPSHIDNISAWSESVVAAFVKKLNRLDWVHKVRVADCVETVERKGDCFEV